VPTSTPDFPPAESATESQNATWSPVHEID
jgi:hypothetical protein